MWISKKRFEEVERKLDETKNKLNTMGRRLDLTIEEFGTPNTASTAWMTNITLEDLARFCIDGKPIKKSVNPEIKVRTNAKHSDYPEYGYYKRGDAL